MENVQMTLPQLQQYPQTTYGQFRGASGLYKIVRATYESDKRSIIPFPTPISYFPLKDGSYSKKYVYIRSGFYQTHLIDDCALPRIAQEPSTTFSDQLQNLIS